jgi:AraC family transcriptional regulator of adaptative response/methylated-DNA-[protein]-cysteine methyltransferase
VRTTGVYCRPGCASRLPRRENVRFFDSSSAAEQAGFRACQRCRPNAAAPNDVQAAAILQACQLMEEAEKTPALADLARAAGLSPSRFQRVFKQAVGVTPKQYAMEHRRDRVRGRLAEGAPVTAAIYDAGYGSSSRFYQESTAALGMTPTTYRDGGQGVRVAFTTVRSHLGWVLVAATDRGVCAIQFGDEPEALKERLEARFSGAELRADDPDLAGLAARTLAALRSPRQGLDLPLDIRGTAFQQRVWQALRRIPAGSTSTYGQVAAAIGQPTAIRAVARACAANEIAVAIPCHRVKRSDGGLGGYRWGVERKQALLDRESQAAG